MTKASFRCALETTFSDIIVALSNCADRLAFYPLRVIYTEDRCFTDLETRELESNHEILSEAGVRTYAEELYKTLSGFPMTRHGAAFISINFQFSKAGKLGISLQVDGNQIQAGELKRFSDKAQTKLLSPTTAAKRLDILRDRLIIFNTSIPCTKWKIRDGIHIKSIYAPSESAALWKWLCLSYPKRVEALLHDPEIGFPHSISDSISIMSDTRGSEAFRLLQRDLHNSSCKKTTRCATQSSTSTRPPG